LPTISAIIKEWDFFNERAPNQHCLLENTLARLASSTI
jgi:hypothetical protein